MCVMYQILYLFYFIIPMYYLHGARTTDRWLVMPGSFNPERTLNQKYIHYMYIINYARRADIYT